MSLESKFNKAMQKAGQRMGKKAPFNIYRPDYTVSDQAGPLIGTRKYRAATQALRFLEPAFPGVTGFELFGDRQFVRSGDVLVPVSGPTITVLHGESEVGTLDPLMGLMTDRVCSITEDRDTVLYTNVRYQWVGPSFPGSGLNEALEDSLKLAKRKVAMYVREGNSAPIRVGMRLLETDNDGPIYWYIADVLSVNKLTILAVREDIV